MSKSSRSKRIVTDVFIYGISDLALKASAFITMPVYTRIFTTADYGVINFLSTTQAILIGLISLGNVNVYHRFYFDAKNHEEIKELTSTWLIFLILWSLAAIFFLFPFVNIFLELMIDEGKNSTANIFAIATIPLIIISSLFNQVLRNQFRAKLFSLLNILTSLLSISLGLVLIVLFGFKVEGIFIGLFTSYCTFIFIRLWFVRELIQFSVSITKLKELLKYGIPFVPFSLSAWIFNGADRYMIAHLSTLSELGLYSVGFNIASVLMLINSAVGQSWAIHALSIYAEQKNEASILFGRMFTLILLLFSFLGVGIVLFGNELLYLLASNEFMDSKHVILPLVLSFIAMSTTQVTGLGISIAKKTKYFAYIGWLTAVVNVWLNYLFIPKYGMVAAGWSTCASYIIVTISYGVISHQFIKTQYQWNKIVAALIGVIVVMLLSQLIQYNNIVINCILKLSLFAIFIIYIFSVKLVKTGDIMTFKALILKR